MNMNNINQNLQFGLVSKLNTGNPIIDSVVHVFIYSFVAAIMMNLQNIFNIDNINRKFHNVYKWLTMFITRYVHQVTYTNKEVQIEYITEEKKFNELYKAMDWYLSTHTLSGDNDNTVRMSVEEEIIGNAEILVPKIKIRPVINSTRYIDYKNHKINFITSKNIVTVYGDKERKRENYVITLTTQIVNDNKNNILQDFCDYVMEKYIASKKKTVWEQNIFINGENGEWKSSLSDNKRKLETVILQDNLLEKIKLDIDDFVDSEKWYHDWGLTYTRGYLLYGKPGCGKTSLIRAVSLYLKRHIHYLMLNNVPDDNTLIKLFTKIDFKQTVLVIEDIDCMLDIVQDRSQKITSDVSHLINEINNLKNDLRNDLKINNISKTETNSKNKLTLSCFLNILDGLHSNNGRIMFMTTNRPEILDKALIRPGRIDQKIKFDYCTQQQIKDIYQMIYKIDVDITKFNQIPEYTLSPAQIICFFANHKNDPDYAINNLNEITLFE